MGAFYSSNNNLHLDTLRYPTLPSAPYLTFNSVMTLLSAGFLSFNVGYSLYNYKELPQSISFKIFKKQKKSFSLNKRFVFALPATGVWGIAQAVFMAANVHIMRMQMPLSLSEKNNGVLDGMLGNFVYFGLLLSQISLFQNNLRLIHPESAHQSWFKYCYAGMSVAALAGYAVFGYYLKELMADEKAAKELMFPH